jgi:hypothetical protein
MTATAVMNWQATTAPPRADLDLASRPTTPPLAANLTRHIGRFPGQMRLIGR